MLLLNNTQQIPCTMKMTRAVLHLVSWLSLYQISSVHGDPVRGSKRIDVDVENGARRQLMQDKDKNKTPTPAPVSRPPTSASLSYRPGEFYDGKTSNDGMLLLSNGLSCKRIATSGEPVRYANGGSSAVNFHRRPDGAAVFAKDDGGWYYVSNSEVRDFCWDWYCGGVGAIEFDWLGNVVGYKRVADKMKQNWYAL